MNWKDLIAYFLWKTEQIFFLRLEKAGESLIYKIIGFILEKYLNSDLYLR